MKKTVVKIREPQNIVPLMLRLRESLRQDLAIQAKIKAKSLNAEIVDRLEESFLKDELLSLYKAYTNELNQKLQKYYAAPPNLAALYVKPKIRVPMGKIEHENKWDSL